ncbi:nucleotidyltransferase domain-containing protein, partial [bacterium]|nr:nucleotidyltransferase domain-containing protein [candidate division CSSED10-310 bacterium]
SRIGIFGSWVKNKQKSRSDIDILARFEKPISLLTLVAIEIQLKKLLKTKVDLVPESDLRPELKNGIIEETIFV